MKEYLVIIEHGPQNWSAYVPDLPGCVAAGTSREDTVTLIREAISLHLEALQEDGQEIPEPQTESISVRISA